MPYAPFLLGVGVVFNLLSLCCFSSLNKEICTSARKICHLWRWERERHRAAKETNASAHYRGCFFLRRIETSPTPVQEGSGPLGPKCPGECLRECPRKLGCPRECPGQTLSGHLLDTLGPGPERHPRHSPGHSLGHPDFREHPLGHSPGHFGPEGPEASCRGSGMSQRGVVRSSSGKPIRRKCHCEVHELSGKESGISSGTPFLRDFVGDAPYHPHGNDYKWKSGDFISLLLS